MPTLKRHDPSRSPPSSSEHMLPAGHPMMQPSNIPRPKRLSAGAPPLSGAGAPRSGQVVEAQSQQQKQSRRDPKLVERPSTSTSSSCSQPSSSSSSSSSSSTTILSSGLALIPPRTNKSIIVPDYSMMRNTQMLAGIRAFVEEPEKYGNYPPAKTSEEQQASVARMAAKRALKNDKGLSGFQLQHVHMTTTPDEIEAARIRLAALVAQGEAATKRHGRVDPIPQRSGKHLEEKENTRREEGMISTTSKKGKNKMSIEEMNEYNRHRQSLLPLRPPQEEMQAAGEISSSSAPGPLDNPFTTGLTSNDLKPHDPITTSPEPAAEEFDTSNSGSTINQAGQEPSNYMVSPSRLPIDPPSFSDICSSTFVYEDRLPCGDKVHRPPLVLGRRHHTSQPGRKVYPKRMRERTPPETLLNTPPGRILKPGQANDLYDPEDGDKYGDLYKPRDPIDYSWLHGSMYSDGPEDASVTLSYEWDSVEHDQDKRAEVRTPTIETRRYVMHAKNPRNQRIDYINAKLAGMVASKVLCNEAWDKSHSEYDEDMVHRSVRRAERRVPTGVPIVVPESEVEVEVVGEAVAAATVPGVAGSSQREPSASPGQSRAHGEARSTSPEGSFRTAVVRADSKSPSRSPKSRSRSEPGIHVSKIPAILNHEEDVQDMMDQEDPSHISISFRSQFSTASQRPARNTPEYYRALLNKLNRPLPPFKPFTGTPPVYEQSARIDSLSDDSRAPSEGDAGHGSDGEIGGRGSGWSFQQDAVKREEEVGPEEDSGQGSEEEIGEGSVGGSREPSGSEDSGRKSDAAEQGEEEQGNEDVESSAPPSPEYRDLPRRVNGVAQRLLTDSFLKAEAAKRRGGSDGSVDRSRSPLEAPISIAPVARAKSTTPEPETVPGRGTWRDGRSRHGFPPPERRVQASKEDLASVEGSEGSAGSTGKGQARVQASSIQDVQGSGDFQTPPPRAVLAEEEVVSSPEATKNTTIPMIDPRREGGQRSPDSPAMHFDPEYDLPRRGRATLETAIGQDGTPASRRTSGQRPSRQATESLDLAELLARLKAKVDGPAGRRGGADNSRHDQALNRSLTILQKLKQGTAERDAALDLMDERCSLLSLSRSAAVSGRGVPADREEATDKRSEASLGGSSVVSQVGPSRLPGVETPMKPVGEGAPGWTPLGKFWVSPATDPWGPRPIEHGPDVFPNFPAYSSDLARRLEEVFGGDSVAASAASEGRAGPFATADHSRSVENPEDSTQHTSVLAPVPSGNASGEEGASLSGSRQRRLRSTFSITSATGKTSRRSRQVHSSPKTSKSGESASVAGRTVGSATVPEGLPTAEDFEAGLFASGSEADTEDLGPEEHSSDDSSADESESATPFGDHSHQESINVEVEPEAVHKAASSPRSLGNTANSTASLSDSRSQAYLGHISQPCEVIFEQTEPSESEEEPVPQGSTFTTTTPVGDVLQRIDERREILFGTANAEESTTPAQPSMIVPSGSYSFENGSPLPARVKELSMLKSSMGSRDATGASLLDRGEEASTRARQMTYPMDTPTRGEVSASGGKSVLSPSTFVTPWDRRRGRPYPRYEIGSLLSRKTGAGFGPVEEDSAKGAEMGEEGEGSPVRAVSGIELRQRSATEPETAMSRPRERRDEEEEEEEEEEEQAVVVLEATQPHDESPLIGASEEAENEIAHSRVYLDKLRGEFRLAEARLDQARRNFLAGVKEFERYQDQHLEAGSAEEAARASTWPNWYRLAWFAAILIATCMFVMWNGHEVQIMDPFYTSRPSGWQTWIMTLFGGATSACRAGFDPACWVWNPSSQDMLLYSRRYAFTPI